MLNIYWSNYNLFISVSVWLLWPTDVRSLHNSLWSLFRPQLYEQHELYELCSETESHHGQGVLRLCKILSPFRISWVIDIWNHVTHFKCTTFVQSMKDITVKCKTTISALELCDLELWHQWVDFKNLKLEHFFIEMCANSQLFFTQKASQSCGLYAMLNFFLIDPWGQVLESKFER